MPTLWEGDRGTRSSVTAWRPRSPPAPDAAALTPSHPIAQEQDKKQRLRGVDAVKANIQAAKAVSRVLRSSLGPKGMDKMLQSPDGDVTISASAGGGWAGGWGGGKRGGKGGEWGTGRPGLRTGQR